LRGDVVNSFICRSVSENVRNGLAQLLDCNGEAVDLVVLFHLDEGVAVNGERGVPTWKSERPTR